MIKELTITEKILWYYQGFQLQEKIVYGAIKDFKGMDSSAMYLRAMCGKIWCFKTNDYVFTNAMVNYELYD